MSSACRTSSSMRDRGAFRGHNLRILRIFVLRDDYGRVGWAPCWSSWLNSYKHGCSLAKFLHTQGGAHGQLVGEGAWLEGGHHVHQDKVRGEVFDLHGDGTEPIDENPEVFSLFLPKVEEGDCGEIMSSACIKLGGEGSGERGEGFDGVGGEAHEPFQSRPPEGYREDLHSTTSSVEYKLTWLV